MDLHPPGQPLFTNPEEEEKKHKKVLIGIAVAVALILAIVLLVSEIEKPPVTPPRGCLSEAQRRKIY